MNSEVRIVEVTTLPLPSYPHCTFQAWLPLYCYILSISLPPLILSPWKSTSPFRSVSKISMTLRTRGFCWSSGMLKNSSTEREPFLLRSNLLKLWLNRRISSASTVQQEKRQEGEVSLLYWTWIFYSNSNVLHTHHTILWTYMYMYMFVYAHTTSLPMRKVTPHVNEKETIRIPSTVHASVQGKAIVKHSPPGKGSWVQE